MRDHGGDLDRAKVRFGGDGWLDLSTGINPVPFPLPPMPAAAWNTLPTGADMAALEMAAQSAYGTRAAIVATAGAQAAIQVVPRLSVPGRACVVGPTYNEHAAALAAQGWSVAQVQTIEDAEGADLAVVVNPNNPDGRQWHPEALLAVRDRVGLLIVDESFADPEQHLSLCPMVHREEDRLIILRSFGKFYGLAGLRLGFIVSGEAIADHVRALVGPWAVSGPAIVAGTAALTDREWHAQTCHRLIQDAARLDKLAQATGWRIVGGTTLFRTYDTGDAGRAQEQLARGRVWSRIFPYSDSWLRLGLPGTEADWAQLSSALAG